MTRGKPEPLERNPVVLGLMILKGMGITEAQHEKCSHRFQAFWVALAAYRDQTKKPWTTKVLDGILSGQAMFDSGEEWVKLNEVLNSIWEDTQS